MPELPKEVRAVGALLSAEGFQAYLVGGCVRDLLRGAAPKDWDVATDATPAEVQRVFPESVYENDFGTVGVKTESEDPKLKVIEITTFRIEGRYTDQRHPDEVRFAKTIEEDLSRRDFTVNALALNLATSDRRPDSAEATPGRPATRKLRSPVAFPMSLTDPFGGQDDLKRGVLRTVGDPKERFGEDALRLMRAVRFAVELDLAIEPATRRAAAELAPSLAAIAQERVRDELTKMLMTPRAAEGIILLEELGLLRYVLPELRDGIRVGQNKHHIYSVFEHNVRSLEYAAKQDYSLIVRLASLLHDVGKPKTKEGDGPNCTFYNHDRVGAKIATRALDRLRFPRDTVDRIAHLIRYHMFYYNVGEVSDAGVRRFLRRVGPETVPDLIKVREADRIGSGVPKAVPYKLRHFLFMIEKVKNDPISPKMLALRGEDVMRMLDIPPSPRVGFVLAVLLEDVLDDPRRNAPEYLEPRVRELGGMTDAALAELARKAREKKDAVEDDIEADMKKKYHVS